MKISIVTPSFNSARYIRETIQSVISQHGDFAIEYFIVDNCSTDGTREIVEKFQRLLWNGSFPLGCNGIELNFISEPDKGMYDAINKGFEKATGDIFAWLNSDDIYLPGAFNIVNKAFQVYPKIKWLKGITSYFDENSTIFRSGKCYLYNQDWIRKGIYGTKLYFIQQDSVFWRHELWEKNGTIDNRLKLAGDYYLWTSFAKNSTLYSINAYLSCFRKHDSQLSHDLIKYREECEMISSSANDMLSKKISFFLFFESKIPVIFLRYFLYYIFFGNQELYLIDLIKRNKLLLKKVSYYVV